MKPHLPKLSMPRAADAGVAGGGADTVTTRSLDTLPRNAAATVVGVEDAGANDAIAERLRELGFVRGELVKLVASGPLGAEPLLVQVGFTRFALRRSEAARVRVQAS